MSETSQQSTPRMNVESFNLDHTKVAAPYVRVADRKELPGGDVLVKYDVRFCQPNRAHLEMEAVHSIEHLSAELMRNHTDRLIDFSPMGCQTGFYALMLGVGTEEFLPLLEATFRDILTAEEVPAANEVQCGWGANHSLAAAQEAVRDFLAAREEEWSRRLSAERAELMCATWTGESTYSASRISRATAISSATVGRPFMPSIALRCPSFMTPSSMSEISSS